MDKFGKICQHHWKERLKSKIAYSESDLLKTKEDLAPQSHKILQMFAQWGAQTCPHHTNVCKIVQLCWAISLLASIHITFKFGNFTIIKVLLSGGSRPSDKVGAQSPKKFFFGPLGLILVKK